MKFPDNLIKLLRQLYLNQRFFLALFTLAVGFLLSFWIRELYGWVWIGAILILLVLLLDLIALFNSKTIEAHRILPDKFSNSDENPVLVKLHNKYPFSIFVEVIEEVPIQFQKRDFLQKMQIAAGEEFQFTYYLRPVERGEYYFGNLNIYVSSALRLSKRRFTFQKKQMIKVYPSFIQMKKYDFLAIDNRISQIGMKKIRRIGHTMEFEQIKDYVSGDDIRSINWKASAKQGSLMINQFQDERSQAVYSVIDLSRTMKMPFNNLKLLDYAINSSLAFSNIAIRKRDKVGLVSFSNTMGKIVRADSKLSHLATLLESLYNINTSYLDSDFGMLYTHLKKKISQRSLIMLYTNFEHISALERQLPYLVAISKKHLLVVIFFENTELNQLISHNAETLPEVIDQAIAEDFAYQKRHMVKELQKYGIQALLTKPEDLSINTINKYLEIKARGIL